MKIEEAIEIIEKTLFYTSFTNDKQDEAFNMAYHALTMFKDYKEDIKKLQLMKDHASIVLVGILTHEIAQLEGSDDNEA